MRDFVTSAPGRLCLFGEHQDYLGLPVIAMAINRRCKLTWTPRSDTIVKVTSEALGDILEFDLNSNTIYDTPLHVAVRELKAHNKVEQRGMGVHIQSDIPIRAGCSSSTALMTAWTAGWSRLFRVSELTKDLVRRCHRAEVLAFGGAGGDMDHSACAHGGLHRFGHGPAQPLPQLPGAFVLGDSGQPKDTQRHLARCKDARLPLMKNLDAPPNDWSKAQNALAKGTRTNRDLEAEWSKKMETAQVKEKAMGKALTQHHAVLRDVLGLSTPRIEAMANAAMQAGAWGSKINGSGGGGCMFAYAPSDRVDAIIEAMLQAGAKGAWHVKPDHGVLYE
ncbi:MAG: hypothetical protein CL849_06205 [Crocinitomicaceae bacterium]|nr:hypothetical protein [Crocinitomicaceae bacterium]